MPPEHWQARGLDQLSVSGKPISMSGHLQWRNTSQSPVWTPCCSFETFPHILSLDPREESSALVSVNSWKVKSKGRVVVVKSCSWCFLWIHVCYTQAILQLQGQLGLYITAFSFLLWFKSCLHYNFETANLCIPSVLHWILVCGVYLTY